MTVIDKPLSWWRAFRLWCSEPVDIASLVAFRILFGALMFLAILRFFLYGWIEAMYQAPRFFFSYWGFSWITPWSGWGMPLHFGIVGLAALGICFGLLYRTSVVVFFLGFTYLELLDKTNYLNHYYLLSLLAFLFCFSPVGRCFSLDAFCFKTTQQTTVPRFFLLLFRFQIGLVYFFAGLAKLQADWLWQAQPLRTWLAARTETPLLGRFFEAPWMAYLMSYAGLLFDLTIVFFLLSPKTRRFAYLAVVLFHLLTFKLFFIGLFPWIMIASALIFFPPSWPRDLGQFFERCLDPLRRLAYRSPNPRLLSFEKGGAGGGFFSPRRPAASGGKHPNPQRLSFFKGEARGGSLYPRLPTPLVSSGLLVFFGLYALLQVLLPLRHHLYLGEVCWTEEGFRFSWMVMLMEKSGHVEFRARDPASGREWHLSPKEYLVPQQIKMMQTQPDMILQFARFLAKEEGRKKAVPRIEIRVDAWASLHGRPRQRLIDPSIDLAAQEDTLRPKPWIVPFQRTPQEQRKAPLQRSLRQKEKAVQKK